MDCERRIVRDRMGQRNIIAKVISAFLRYPKRYSNGGASEPQRCPACGAHQRYGPSPPV
jgi:hypothetical protein